MHHGLVLISDGQSQPRPARLELSSDSLAVQVPQGSGTMGEEGEIESMVIS